MKAEALEIDPCIAVMARLVAEMAASDGQQIEHGESLGYFE
jgi:hypothetical protein